MKGEAFKLFIVIGIGITMGVQFGNGLVICDTSDSDSDLNQCFVDIIVDFNLTWSAGIPELNIPPMNPLAIDGASLAGQTVGINFQANITNTQVQGISQFTNLGFQVNTIGHFGNFTVAFPGMTIIGDYSATGSIILPLIPFTASGSVVFQLVAPVFTGGCSLRNETNGTVTVLVLYDCVGNIGFTDYSVTVYNMGPLLGPLVNTFLNVGRSMIFEQCKATVNSKLGEIIPMVNPFLQTQPYLAAILK